MLQILKKITKYSDIALAFGIIGILMVLLFPVPTGLLDLLLAFSIATSIIILMTTLFIAKPLELSVFPTILLVTTLMRLSLNIASTRLILADGHLGTEAAGHVIEAFGSFVMQGNVVIGLIVFLILTIINFIVITKGSGRIAEVAARFSLDAMPGKQMAIDADLAAGLINEATAKVRRQTLEDESTFYGAMDGANKFVRGDAIAGLVITFINLVGGMIIGILQRKLNFDTAIQTYTILTIGEGLVAQIPSLIISLASGLLVTKSGIIGSADKAIFGQLGQYPQPLFMTAVVIFMMGLAPGLPFIPFAILSIIASTIGYIIYSAQQKEVTAASAVAQKESKSDAVGDNVDAITESLQLDAIRLEIGYGLISLVNNQKNQRLTEQIKALRKQIAKDFGFVMPSVRIQDNTQLDNETYVIKIKELEAGRGVVRADKLMVMDPKGQLINLPGEDTQEPAFGLPAKWINETHKDEALFYNYTVVDPATVITTHLTEVIKENITELLSYSETQKLLDEIGEDNKKLVKDIVPDLVSISTLQKILQNLLAEMISIRDLPTILEAVADAVRIHKSLTSITEFVRHRLARQICHHNTNSEGFIPIVTVSPAWEQVFTQSLVSDGEDKQLSMMPSKLHEFVARVKQVYDEQALNGYIPVLLTSGTIRPYVRSIIGRFRPATVVMSQNEIHYRAKIRTLGVI
jgi:flagellar biosynthesis protein FlhA